LPSIPAGWITAAGIATDAIDADALAADAATQILDAIRQYTPARRDLTAVAVGSRTVEDAWSASLGLAVGNETVDSTGTVYVRYYDTTASTIMARFVLPTAITPNSRVRGSA
jgi:hypothetical protein